MDLPKRILIILDATQCYHFLLVVHVDRATPLFDIYGNGKVLSCKCDKMAHFLEINDLVSIGLLQANEAIKRRSFCF